jgi:hypothetical protein
MLSMWEHTNKCKQLTFKCFAGTLSTLKLLPQPLHFSLPLIGGHISPVPYLYCRELRHRWCTYALCVYVLSLITCQDWLSPSAPEGPIGLCGSVEPQIVGAPLFPSTPEGPIGLFEGVSPRLWVAHLSPSTPEGPIGLFEGVAPRLWVAHLSPSTSEGPIGLYESIAPRFWVVCLLFIVWEANWAFESVLAPLWGSCLSLSFKISVCKCRGDCVGLQRMCGYTIRVVPPWPL